MTQQKMESQSPCASACSGLRRSHTTRYAPARAIDVIWPRASAFTTHSAKRVLIDLRSTMHCTDEASPQQGATGMRARKEENPCRGTSMRARLFAHHSLVPDDHSPPLVPDTQPAHPVCLSVSYLCPQALKRLESLQVAGHPPFTDTRSHLALLNTMIDLNRIQQVSGAICSEFYRQGRKHALLCKAFRAQPTWMYQALLL